MRAAPLPHMFAAQAALELRLALRRGEAVLVTLVIPPLLLAFLSTGPALIDRARPGESAKVAETVAVFLPGMLALAVMSAAMVSLAISTGYERYYGVLKRLGGSPLSRWVLIAAKLAATLAVELLQLALLIAVALVLGWRPEGIPPLAPLLILLAMLLGTAAFGGLGLWMAGTWRAEATLAGANALYILLLLFGGIVVSPASLPGPMGAVSSLLPSAALAGVLRAAFASAEGGTLASALVTLAVWAALAPTLAAITFKWE